MSLKCAMSLKCGSPGYRGGIFAGALALAVIMSACTTPDTNSGQTPGALAEAGSAKEAFPVRKIDRSKFPAAFAVQEVAFPGRHQSGSVVVDLNGRFLYLVRDGQRALRYPIAVGAEGQVFEGITHVRRKQVWPAWRPTPSMHAEGELPRMVEPGPHNPLGARALYLYKDGRDTLLRIHGTSEPWLIGQNVSSGCIRMLDEDVVDLYGRVRMGAAVSLQRGI